MTPVLRAARAAVSLTIMVLVGISFLPRTAASRLVAVQKFLNDEIERRARS